MESEKRRMVETWTEKKVQLICIFISVIVFAIPEAALPMWKKTIIWATIAFTYKFLLAEWRDRLRARAAERRREQFKKTVNETKERVDYIYKTTADFLKKHW